MVVIVVMSAVAIPSLSALNDSKDGLASSRVLSALRHAQALAMATNRLTWVVFDTGTDTVSVYAEDPANPGKANRLAATDPLTRGAMSVVLNADAFDGVSITAVSINGTVEVQFDTLGRPYDTNGVLLAANGTVDLSSGDTITITKVTGLVDVN